MSHVPGRSPALTDNKEQGNDLPPGGHIQAIANTAVFHFCFIEQGGSSLYPPLAQKRATRKFCVSC